VGDGDVARRLLAGAVEVLMPGVQRNGKKRAGFPFEGDAFAGVVPDGRRTATIKNENHLFEQLALRREVPPRRDLADVTVVRRARRLVIDEHGGATAPRPWLERDIMKIRHIMGADDF